MLNVFSNREKAGYGMSEKKKRVVVWSRVRLSLAIGQKKKKYSDDFFSKPNECQGRFAEAPAYYMKSVGTNTAGFSLVPACPYAQDEIFVCDKKLTFRRNASSGNSE